MGASDGPAFAPARPGSKPILSPPCGCLECVAGEGLSPERVRRERMERALGPITKLITYDFCPDCRDSVITTAVRSGPGWENTCAFLHTWTSFD